MYFHTPPYYFFWAVSPYMSWSDKANMDQVTSGGGVSPMKVDKVGFGTKILSHNRIMHHALIWNIFLISVLMISMNM